MGSTKSHYRNTTRIRQFNNLESMIRYKILSENLSFKPKDNYVEGTFTMSNNQIVKFEITPEYSRQWGADKEVCAFTVDRLAEIMEFYFGTE